MRIGLQVTDLGRLVSPADFGKKLAEIARTADDMGFFSFWVPDHLLNAMSVFGQPIDAPILEGYSTISYLAALTQRIKVGLQVTCPLFRHPAVLVKTVSTIDVLSGGRAYLGIGAGWFEREAKGLGIAFPSRRERFERLEETLQIAKHMWAGNTRPFGGKYYQLSEPINSPQPLSQPHPPILIGGEGEKKTLRLVAKYANACNIRIGSPLEESPASSGETRTKPFDLLRRKLEILGQHCKDVGRSYADIEKTVQAFISLSPNTQDATRVIELCRQLAEAGVQHIIFNISNVYEITPLEIMGAQVIPKLPINSE